MLRTLAPLALVCALACDASAAALKRASGAGKQVKLVSVAGMVIKIREKHAVRDVKLAPDGSAAAWLLDDLFLEDWKESHSSQLVVYRDGKRRVLDCGVIIRDFWFWNNGAQIAWDCGGRRFAGNEVLFDTRTLETVDSFHQAEVDYEQRPAWSRGAEEQQ